MARSSKKPPETINCLFSAIPHAVLDSRAFTGATDKAKALLFAFIRQHSGSNNGHIQITPQWLKKQGFTSSGNWKARDELLERGLIIQTRWGGLNAGPNYFALSWLIISNFVGLDISADNYQRGAWALCELPPTPRRAKPTIKKREKLSDQRNSAVPTSVTATNPPITTSVTKKALLDDLPVTTSVNNEVNTNASPNRKGRITGLKGRSGVKKQFAAQE